MIINVTLALDHYDQCDAGTDDYYQHDDHDDLYDTDGPMIMMINMILMGP